MNSSDRKEKAAVPPLLNVMNQYMVFKTIDGFEVLGVLVKEHEDDELMEFTAVQRVMNLSGGYYWLSNMSYISSADTFCFHLGHILHISVMDMKYALDYRKYIMGQPCKYYRRLIIGDTGARESDTIH